MGLYGSPDTGNLYSNIKRDWNKTKKPFYKNWFVWLLVILDIFIVFLNGMTKDNILGIIALDCIVISMYAVINIIYNLIKRNRISKYIKLIIFSLIAFGISTTLMYNNDQDVVSNKNLGIVTEQLGQRKNPAKINEIVTVGATSSDGANCVLEIELLEVKKGNDANNILQNIRDYGTGPEENREYTFAKFRIKNIKNNASKDLPFILNNAYFSYSNSSYKKYKDFMTVSGLSPDINAELYEGAEHIGWICLYTEKNDPSPKAVFLGGEGVWFDL